jgi:gliding motility associated protien GldN
MKKAIIITGIFSFVFLGISFAQESTVLDGVYIKEHTINRKVIPYAHLREADVMWLHRVWRELDLRQKMNHPLYYPFKPMQGRRNLFDVMIDAITKEGTLTAYSIGITGEDDMFTQELTQAEVQSMLADTQTVFTEDPDTGEQVPTQVVNPIEVKEVKKYQLKEEWFFDRQRSVLDVRIIGICPIIDTYNEYGEYKGPKKLFWVYFPEARQVFAKADVFNRFNDAERRTFEDIFWKRQFSSYIIKESNVYDRFISEYKVGLDALIESEEIKEKIFNMEHDLWEY